MRMPFSLTLNIKKANKKIKRNSSDMMLCSKETPKIELNLFFCWPCYLFLRVVCFPSEISWIKLFFSFESNYQVDLDCMLCMGIYLLLSALGPHLIQSHASPMHAALLYLEGLNSLLSSICFSSYALSASSHSFLNLERRDLMETSLLGLSQGLSLSVSLTVGLCICSHLL